MILRVMVVVCAAVFAGMSEQGGTGTVTGTVRLTAARRAPLATSAYGRRGVGPRRDASGPETKNVIIFAQGASPSAPPAPMRARITQQNEQFVPQVVAITAGSTVEFPNDDPFFHNVFSLSRAKAFDLGRYPTGKSRAVTFDKPGVVKVFCDIHSHMSALIMVFDHPWFTIPSEDGTYTLPLLPPGELTIVAWHERIGERRERLTVGSGGTVSLSFTLPVLEAP